MQPHEPSTAVRQHILLVEDDPQIAGLTVRYLENHGYRCSTAGDAASMQAILQQKVVDLILLDLGLPDEDGLMALRRLDRDMPVIIVTGRGESTERVVGLELGADDYISKPFDFRELLARMRSVLRRAASSRQVANTVGCIEFDGLLLDVDARILTSRDGARVTLTCTEFELLHALLERPGQALTRDQLMNHLHGRDAGPFDRAIDVYIGRLRRKIERDPVHPQLIQSERSIGYRFSAKVTHA